MARQRSSRLIGGVGLTIALLVTMAAPAGAATNPPALIRSFASHGSVYDWSDVGGGLAGAEDLAADSTGNVYVADSDNHRIVKLSPTGAVIGTWGGAGTANGKFNDPHGVAVHSGNVYVADTQNNRIQVFDTNGTFIRKWGTQGSLPGRFNFPRGVVVANNRVYVVDSQNNRIQRFTLQGVFDIAWGSSGAGDGQFNFPHGIDSDGSGNLYVVENGGNRLQVFTADGSFVTRWAVSDNPPWVEVDSVGNVYVTGSGVIRKYTSGGTLLTQFLPINRDSTLSITSGIAIDGANRVYVATENFSTGATRVERFTADGNPVYPYGPSRPGAFNGASSLTVDSAGALYVADSTNDRIQKFNTSGTFTAQWGGLGTGNGAFDQPTGVAAAPNGNIVVADTRNQRVQVFTAAGGFVRKWGSEGSGNGQFRDPGGVAVDGAGNVYVADTSNNRIQKFNSSGTFLTSWGTVGGGTGQFSSPQSVAVTSAGDVYVAESGNDRIQQFTSQGAFVRAWGSNGTGDGQFRGAYGVAVDPSGNVYVGDGGNNRVQMFNSSGTFLAKWTVPASGTPFFRFLRVAADGRGNVYVSDTGVDSSFEFFDRLHRFQFPGRPDARIRVGATGTLKGDDVYNTTGAGQGAAASARRGASVTFQIPVQNDGVVADRFKLKGQAGNANYRVRYLDRSGANITSAVTAGTFTTPSLAPGGVHTIRAVVTVQTGAAAGSSLARTLTATSKNASTAKDTVKFTTRRS